MFEDDLTVLEIVVNIHFETTVARTTGVLWDSQNFTAKLMIF
jgi:hypothetical protein